MGLPLARRVGLVAPTRPQPFMYARPRSRRPPTEYSSLLSLSVALGDQHGSACCLLTHAFALAQAPVYSARFALPFCLVYAAFLCTHLVRASTSLYLHVASCSPWRVRITPGTPARSGVLPRAICSLPHPVPPAGSAPRPPRAMCSVFHLVTPRNRGLSMRVMCSPVLDHVGPRPLRHTTSHQR